MRPGRRVGLLLTPQEQALVGVLLGVYPRVVRSEHLIDRLPGRDHAAVRGEQLVPILVCRVRKKLGADAILTVRGVGFTMGPRLYDEIHAAEAA